MTGEVGLGADLGWPRRRGTCFGLHQWTFTACEDGDDEQHGDLGWVQGRQAWLIRDCLPPHALPARPSQGVSQRLSVPVRCSAQDELLECLHLELEVRVRDARQKVLDSGRVRATVGGVQPTKQRIVCDLGIADATGLEQTRKTADLARLTLCLPPLPCGQKRTSLAPDHSCRRAQNGGNTMPGTSGAVSATVRVNPSPTRAFLGSGCQV